MPPRNLSYATSTSREARAPTLTQQPPARISQQRPIDHTTLVPIYVLPENRHAVEQFVLSLGQPLFSPSGNMYPASQAAGATEFHTPDGSLYERSLLSGSDSSQDDVELVSVMAPMSLGGASIQSRASPIRVSSPHNEVPGAFQSRIPAYSTGPTGQLRAGNEVPVGFQSRIPAHTTPTSQSRSFRAPSTYTMNAPAHFSGTRTLVPPTAAPVRNQPISRLPAPVLPHANASFPVPAQALPNMNPAPYVPVAVNMSAVVDAVNRKYYAVYAGKKCGVFWEEWYVHFSRVYGLLIYCSTGLILKFLSRPSRSLSTKVFVCSRKLISII